VNENLLLTGLELGRKKLGPKRKAYREHGYTMQAIVDQAGLHHSTVSLLIRANEENPRNKSSTMQNPMVDPYSDILTKVKKKPMRK